MIMYFYNKQLSILFRYIRRITVVFLVLFIILAILKIQFIHTDTFAIIMDKKSPLKSEPFTESKDLIYIPEGTKVHIQRSADQWIEIELPDGNKGWVKQQQLGII